jgi:hypothetical protein
MMIFTFESTKSSKNKNGQLKNRATKKPVWYSENQMEIQKLFFPFSPRNANSAIPSH